MKMMKVVIALALALCLAAPAFAEMKLNGYYRLQGTYYDVDNNDATNPSNDIVQRLRLKLTNQLNENVGFVYYGEFDSDWGQGDKFGGNGAKRGGDGNVLETKNAYLTLKNDSFDATLGLQGYSDVFSGLLFSDDAAGATFNTKLGAAKLGLVYFKFQENSVSQNDDFDVYGGTVSFAATDALTLGGAVYYAANQGGPVAGSSKLNADGSITITPASATTDEKDLYYGVRADFKATDALSLSGFGLFADFEDGDNYVLDASANFKFAQGNLLFEGLYSPDKTDSGDFFHDTGDANFFYNGQNLMFLLRDIYATNNWEGEGKYQDALTTGAGLTMLMLSGNYDFGAFYAGFGVGYADTDTDELGTEIGVKVGKKFFSNVDVSVRAAQWSAGDFYGAADYDETKVIGMLNVGF